MERMKNVSGESKEYKSWVSTRFTLINDSGVAKRRCKAADCTKEYSRGTSHMILKRHWSKQHGAHFENAYTYRPRSKQNNLSESSANPNYKQQNKKKPLNANNLSPSSGNVGSTGYRNKSSNQNISQLSASNFNEKTQLDVKLVSKRLKEATSIHLTFDIHTAKKGAKSYGIVTAHSLSDSMELRSVLLEYRHLPYPDEPSSIYEFLRSCMVKFNIKEKIVSICSNCSVTVSHAIQEIDRRFRLSKNFSFSTIHLQCFPQFIHMNILEVLRSQESLIESVRKVIGFINSNNFTLGTLQQVDPNAPAETVVQNSAPLDNSNVTNMIDQTNNRAAGLKLPYDNRTSWNTTYNMIDIFLQQRGIIEPTLLYFQDPQDPSGVNIDWDRLYTLLQLLKPFYEIVQKFASDNYTPASLVAALIPRIINHLSSSSWVYDDLSMAAHNFEVHLEEYRRIFHNDLTVIATFLDPRIKDSFLSPASRHEALEVVRKRVEDTISTIPLEAQPYRMSENSIFYHLFRHRNPNELVDYLETERESARTSVPSYWSAYKHEYPKLYTLAKSLLCIQVSSVPGDRMFSAAENVDRERKVHVESTNSKELMKSWAKYLEK